MCRSNSSVFDTIFCLVFTKAVHSTQSLCARITQQQQEQFQSDSPTHRVVELCFLCSVMSEEVTYATLQFPSPSKSKKLQESGSLKRTGKVLYAGSDRPKTIQLFYQWVLLASARGCQTLLRFSYGMLVHSKVAMPDPKFIYLVQFVRSLWSIKEDCSLSFWKCRFLVLPQQHFLYFLEIIVYQGKEKQQQHENNSPGFLCNC